MKKTTLSSLAAILTFSVIATAQADNMPTREQMWKMLQAQQQKIEALESKLNQAEHKVEKVVTAVESNTKRRNSGMHWSDKITLSGVVEVEAVTNRSYANVDTNDLVLATAELGVDAQINDWVSANIAIKYEEGANGDAGTPLGVDSASITIANADKTPFYLTAGSITVPFGGYSTLMSGDPMTQTLGETAESAVQVGFNTGLINGAVYAFNGTSSESGASDVIDQFGASLGLTHEGEKLNFELGMGWINALEDSDNLQATVPSDIAAMVDHIAGAEIHSTLTLGGITVNGEYVTAMNSFDSTEMTFNGNSAKPSAWNVELGYTFQLAEMETTIAAGYQESSEALSLGLPEKRIRGGFSMGIYENTTLSFEYARDKDYSTSDSAGVNSAAETAATGATAHSSSMKLGVEF
jgi:hypothetical protein